LNEITVRTPFGDLHTDWSDQMLTGIRFGAYTEGTLAGPDGIPDYACHWLGRLIAYFDGDRYALVGWDTVPSGTPFQMQVWEATLAVRYGKTASYGSIAKAVGVGAEGSRAVGVAVNQNPLPLLVPCHRVIGTNGDLTGFGGGLSWKRALLDLEAPQVALSF